ncbi:hypothetical protein BDZ94DRAFT_652231 [Collybia nuda]|uniref:F-box domain-containing protein n=1 Tax=Collybia nuda TaxID=64659 RepID=A0A9P6CJP9_9AGAR|nr:hypothetical protein BDZ94DRAFT_652231 [Collybia nuda]
MPTPKRYTTTFHRSMRLHLDTECQKLQTLIDRNRKVRARIEREMPLIECLSSEIISRVFKFTIAFSYSHIHDLPSPFVVSQVNQRWRSVVVNDASLWTKLYIFPGTSPEVVRAYLLHSKQHLLNLTFYLSPPQSLVITPDDLRALFETVIPASHRWKSLTVLTSDVSLLARCEKHLVGVLAPNLKRLQLSSFSGRRLCYKPRFPKLFATSSLSHLILHHECINERFAFASHITKLHLAGIGMAGYEQLYNILSRCTVLEHRVLDIVIRRVPALPFQEAYQGVIKLSSLHTLHLRNALCFHLFDAPALHTLYLTHDPIFSNLCKCEFNPAQIQCEQLTGALEHMGAYRFGGIRHFGVTGPNVEYVLASLVLMEEKACLGALITPANFWPYWPQLETISLPALRSDVTGWVCRFMIARFPAKGIRLPKIRLPAPFAADPLTEWLQEKNCREHYENDIDFPRGDFAMRLEDVLR